MKLAVFVVLALFATCQVDAFFKQCTQHHWNQFRSNRPKPPPFSPNDWCGDAPDTTCLLNKVSQQMDRSTPQKNIVNGMTYAIDRQVQNCIAGFGKVAGGIFSMVANNRAIMTPSLTTTLIAQMFGPYVSSSFSLGAGNGPYAGWFGGQYYFATNGPADSYAYVAFATTFDNGDHPTYDTCSLTTIGRGDHPTVVALCTVASNGPSQSPLGWSGYNGYSLFVLNYYQNVNVFSNTGAYLIDGFYQPGNIFYMYNSLADQAGVEINGPNTGGVPGLNSTHQGTDPFNSLYPVGSFPWAAGGTPVGQWGY